MQQIVVTSDTIDSEEVKKFIVNVKDKALDYAVIWTSPSLGTGVDITFPDKAKHIDVVFGFFDTPITTHFDCDQQIARVRHPGAVKVWVSSQRFNFDTALDVVRRDILEKSLYVNTYQGFQRSWRANLSP